MEKDAELKRTKNVNEGANVRKLRQILGIKQSAFAEKLGIDQSAVSRLESRRVIEEDMLLKIANIFNVSPKIIQELEENPLSVVVENNTFESGSYNYGGTINDENHQHIIHPLEKIVELNKQTSDLYERMLALEKEKSALLEQLLKEKQG
ncbi:helix-turn-helix transcriptional regulator [uncultured Parabacteroides sp.]|jgi:transcriptional regulator with XRE-family HTH domain|uniref:helix-turn-helix domain-containing protein n=1 Tax=uncultured Parabacteroides sp. TaxID=512312 RepID=UPI0025D21E7B|nr:helix-turn-helix transcriptional regulator [uncultured Parabacteroides sp.]